jgi:hypothetical protein
MATDATSYDECTREDVWTPCPGGDCPYPGLRHYTETECEHCPHDPSECRFPDPDDCPHWHYAPDINVPVTPDMVEAATLLDASGAELLGHAVRSALADDDS